MKRLCIDTIGELPDSGPPGGYKFVLVVLDTFTRWIELYPLQSTEAIEAADALLDYFCRYGEPKELQSDRGNQFVNSLIEAMTAKVGIHQALSLAYSKQENGRVERANKEVYRHLNAILFHHRVRADWHKYLPFVRRIMNAQEREVTGHSPAQLLFGDLLHFNRFALSGNHKEGVF
jgi:transposase InsO family protein